ncbi:MAG TPA: PASTA domain-containing protein [Bryobacteraceae bacterium]|nr:PASTA domain-containing protein [Bryobacteraceae bacterium]
MTARWDVSRLRTLLNLTKNQEQQAIRIYSNAAIANAPVRASLRNARASLASAMKANDTVAITQASNTIGNLRSRLGANNAQARAAFVRILTPEQEIKYRQLLSRTRNRPRGRPSAGRFATDRSGPAALQPTSALPQGSYTITDLGVLTAQEATDSAALAINNSGIVVGFSGVYDADFEGYLNQDAFIWTPSPTDPTTGTMSHLNGLLPDSTCIQLPFLDPFTGGLQPGGPSKMDTVASGVNNSGQVVGYSWATADGICNHGTNHGFIYDSTTGGYTDLGLPPGFTLIPPATTHISIPNVESQAAAINDAGQVVGFAAGDRGANAVWLYDGNYHILESLPDELVFPTAINNRETTVGDGFTHTGTGPINPLTDGLGTLGGTESTAFGINDSGMIVGSSETGSGFVHAFLRDQFGNMKDLGGLSTDIWDSNANGINNSGHDVVGSAELDLTIVPDYFAETNHAVIWPSGGPAADLNLLLDPSLVVSESCPSCWELTEANAINDRGQIVGTGSFEGHFHAFLLTPKCINDGGDTDGDGICDTWEKYGYTDPNTGKFVDLPAMGADPMHKDIFVQADYMVVPSTNTCGSTGCVFGHTHKPNGAAMIGVMGTFAHAPVANPDGTTGINLHIDCGSDCIMNLQTGATWGDLSQAQSIAEIPVLGGPVGGCVPGPDPTAGCDYDFSAFDFLKQSNFAAERAPVFHYMIFAHNLGIYDNKGNLTFTSGISDDIPTDSFIVALGHYAGQVGNSFQQASTFMHELGHNLGLHHGGLDDTNYKPNYLSVMNYLFQMNGIYIQTLGGTIDYSRFSFIPQLNENALNDAVGLQGGPLLANYGTSYFCPGGDPIANTGMQFVPNANGPIDWKCDGNPTETNVQADVNAQLAYPPGGSPTPVYQKLVSFDDWPRLIYNGGAIGATGVGAPRRSGHSDFEYQVPINPSTPFQLQVVSPGLAQVLPGATLNLTYTLTNTGVQQDTYSLTPVTQYAWWNTASVPGSVTLAGGASQQITIPVTVPSGFGCGGPAQIRATFTLQAVSQTLPSLTDSGVAELDLNTSTGVVVPAVTGLAQATAQAAILSAGFVVGTVTTQASVIVPAGSVISQSPAFCAATQAGSPVSITVSTGPPETVVPNVVGQTQAAALAALNTAGLTPGSAPVIVFSSTIPPGVVVTQNPPAGTTVTAGSFFSLTVAGATSNNVLTPNVLGADYAQALATLTAAGLNLGLITNEFSLTVPAGKVMSQVPATGSLTSFGSYVNVTVSFGDKSLKFAPNILGDTQTGAISAILSAGLSIGSIGESSSNTAPKGTVTLQNPLAGITVSADSPVSFSISAGPVGPQSFVVPNVYGLSQAAASSAITAAGLTVGTITPSQQLSVPVGNVFSQTPLPGAYVAGGSAVNLQVSAAAAQYTVPDLVTNPTPYSTAYTEIIAAGLTPGTFTTQFSSTVPFANVISQSPAAGSVVAGGSVVNVTYSAGIAVATVPSVVGENQVFATNSINPGLSFFVSVTRAPSTTVPDSFVISQNPPASTQAPRFVPINLVVSSGGAVTAAVPNVVGTAITGGTSITGAEPTLNAAGFAVGSVTYQPSDSVPRGVVISQNPPAGTLAAWDASVSLVYSSGPAASITVPNIIGETEAIAISTLSANSLQWTLTTQSSQTVTAGVVISQNPSAGTVLQGVVPPGQFNAPVTFVVSAGPNTVPTYSLLSQFGDYGGPFSGDGQFYSPTSLAIDPNTGNILAGDQTGRIQIFDRNGNFKGSFGGTGVQGITATVPGSNQVATIYPAGTGGGLFVSYPIGLAVDPINGNVVALDAFGRVLIFNSAGAFQSTFGSPGTLGSPANGPGQFAFYPQGGGVAIDPVTENILVTDWGNDRVQIFSSTGVYQGQFGTQGAGNGQFGFGPIGIAIDPATRNIVVKDRGNSRVEIFNSSGTYLSQFGAPVQAANATWDPSSCACEGLAIDAVSHNIIVQGAIGGFPSNSSVQIFDSKGNYLSQFGGFDTSFSAGLAVDPVSHHIVTFGLAGAFVGTVQIFGAPGALTPTTTALTSSLNPAAFGQSVTFTATVSGASPTGTVQFYFGATPLGAPVTLVAGTASFTTSSLPIGTDSITAIYSGDANNTTSTSPLLNETITGGASTTTLAASASTVVVGHPVTFTATVTGSKPSGTVEFLNGATSLGAPVVLAAGVAMFTVSNLPVGSDSITAVYSGDAGNAPSTSPALIETVSKAGTVTTIVTSSAQVIVGQTVTITALVSGYNPTGTVQFMDGASSLGAPVALTGNVATLTLSTLPAGTHSITAVYSGDGSNAGSTSPVLSEVVNLHSTTPTIVSSLNPATAGQSVTFTSTVPGNSPTGTVQFMDGNIGLGAPVALSSGTASMPFSKLSVGTHPVTAFYSGDSSNSAGASPILNQVVSAAATAPVVTAPAPVTIPATQAAGATSSASPPLARFLAGATAVESISPPPAQLLPEVGGAPVSNTTLFPVGTTTVTFIFKDSSGNVGRATSTVTVVIGTPRITGSTVGAVGTDPSGAIYVNVVLTNTGTGNARNLNIGTLTLRTLSGTGTVTYNTKLSPALPVLVINNLDVGNKVAVRFYLNVPSTVTRMSITESGPVQDVVGTHYNYSTAEAVIP